MPSAATWMGPEVILLSEISQKEKNKYIYHLYVNLKIKRIQWNLFTKQKRAHRHRKQIYGYQRGKGRRIS